MDAHGQPVRAILTSGTVADCTQALPLMEGLGLQGLLADRGYDTDAIVQYALEHDIVAVIPPKRNRRVQRNYDKELYRLRHPAENAFLHLKR